MILIELMFFRYDNDCGNFKKASEVFELLKDLFYQG